MERIAQILASADFVQLIGTAEDIFLEVKSAPFDLATAAGRYELAKDVSAFANSQGGYLLIGLRTARSPTTQVDIIDQVALISQGAFNAAQYAGVIGEYISPTIEGLGVDWKQSTDSNDGLGVVFVPTQNTDRKPFLICRVVEDGQHLKAIVAGYADRSGSSNDPLSPKHLQQAMQKGRDTYSSRMTRIEEKLNLLLDRSPSVEKVEIEGGFDTQNLQARIKSIVDVDEDSE